MNQAIRRLRLRLSMPRSYPTLIEFDSITEVSDLHIHAFAAVIQHSETPRYIDVSPRKI